MIQDPMIGSDGQICPSAVLVVDDNVQVAGALQRYLQRRFDRVFVAFNPTQARAILEQETITALVCDYDLGQGIPNGVELISAWRKQFQSIERAVILTGSDLSKIPKSRAVDERIPKSAPLSEIARVLWGQIIEMSDSQIGKE